MKARERLAAFVITIGLSILVLLGLWIWAQLASRRRVRGYRGEPLIDIPLPRDPETLMWIATIGGEYYPLRGLDDSADLPHAGLGTRENPCPCQSPRAVCH